MRLSSAFSHPVFLKGIKTRPTFAIHVEDVFSHPVFLKGIKTFGVENYNFSSGFPTPFS